MYRREAPVVVGGPLRRSNSGILRKASPYQKADFSRVGPGALLRSASDLPDIASLSASADNDATPSGSALSIIRTPPPQAPLVLLTPPRTPQPTELLNLHALIVGVYKLHVSVYRCPSYADGALVPTQAPAQVAIQGLQTYRTVLEDALVAPLTPATRFLFHSNHRPQRVIFCSSEPGSGIKTHLEQVCSDLHVNTIHISLASEPALGKEFSDADEFFTNVLLYAGLMQPCVVVFDRCDAWFKDQGGYVIRGDRFRMAHRAIPSLVNNSDDVWFLFSCDDGLSTMDESFASWVGSRCLHQSSLLPEERAEVFCQFFRAWLASLREAFLKHVQEHAVAPAAATTASADSGDEDELEVPEFDREAALRQLELEELRIMESYSAMSLQWAEHHPQYSPRMVHQYCRQLVDITRQRVLREHKGPLMHVIDPNRLLPRFGDFEFVDASVEKTMPGTVFWRY
jgi:hypothetical protein